MVDLNSRIRNLIQEKNLSPSHFADEIGVQRSSISHILSGRNRPSLEIVQKIIRRFPDLTYEWLLGEKPATLTMSARGGVSSVNRYADRNEAQQVKTTEILKKNATESVRGFTVLQESNLGDEQKKTRVVKITLFYDDNTFEEFKPNV